ncbi:DNRLRE domain-containing protein [Roseibacillus ishigakijimensis]|uniref:DNRLRE domain-containing protein n=1 Tax=Roseibacillus ishigakijimensis TaxID=454146 RepID=A0A934VMU0_9BACT|nr:DNRLRE domain-containing protein [Roseibacillus ishigakijimensis]MBK1834451.1 DNRLRE domain-containing protein [Roseibacillus ishigakijimensis]
MKTTLFSTLLISLGASSLPGALSEVTYSLQEGEDGYAGSAQLRIRANGDVNDGAAVDTGHPDPSQRQTFYLDGGFDAESNRADMLFRFENALADLPAGAVITQARFELTTSDVTTSNPSGGTFNVYRLTNGFDPGSTTYANLSAAGGVQMGESADMLSGSFSGMTANGTTVSADVTRIVQSWVNGDPVHGFGVRSDRSNDGWSVETVSSSQTSGRPKLVISYTTDPVQLHEYQQGKNGYAGGRHALISSNSPTEMVATAAQVFLDGSDGDQSYDDPYLLAFDGVENDIAGQQVELGELTLVTGFASSAADSGGPYTIHQLLLPFDQSTVVYDDFAGDVTAMMAANQIGPAVAAFTGMSDTEVVTADVSAILQNWADGEANYGFYIAADGTSNGWQIFSNDDPEFAPYLRIITSQIPEPSTTLFAAMALVPLLRRRR